MDSFFDIEVPLVFNPELLGGQRGDGKGWWIVGEADPSLGKYLRKLYAYSTYHVSLLMRPAWADHITIVRDSQPTITDFNLFWNKWRDVKINVRIILRPETNGLYWWLPVISEAACNIRRDLGLVRQPEIPLHLTFGHSRKNA